MPNHMKFCGCKTCRRGRGGGVNWVVRYVNRKLRRKTKEALRQGKEPDRVISVPYTD